MDKKVLILFFTRRLAEIVGTLIERQDSDGLKKLMAVIEDIGHLSVNARLRDVIHEVIQAFYHAGTSAARKQLPVCDSLIESLVRIERQISKTDRELYSEINFAKQEIERCLKANTVEEERTSGIQTSDLW
jgi:hypothetical protein